jgi:hypothetical protein
MPLEMALCGGMEPVRVVWAGLIVVVQAPSGGASAPSADRWPGQAPPLGVPWAGPAGHDGVFHQVSAWLTGLRQGVQAAPPLPGFHCAPPPSRPDVAAAENETPLPGFYL